jgi:hypothetical protein
MKTEKERAYAIDNNLLASYRVMSCPSTFGPDPVNSDFHFYGLLKNYFKKNICDMMKRKSLICASKCKY